MGPMLAAGEPSLHIARSGFPDFRRGEKGSMGALELLKSVGKLTC